MQAIWQPVRSVVLPGSVRRVYMRLKAMIGPLLLFALALPLNGMAQRNVSLATRDT